MRGRAPSPPHELRTTPLRRERLCRAITASALAGVAACGGGDKSGTGPPRIASVTLSAQSTSLQVGQTLQVSAAVRDASGNAMSGTAIVWSSQPASIASVDGTGLVTGIVPGTVAIHAASGGVTGQLALSVTPAAVALITVTPSAPTVEAGRTLQLTAKTWDAHGNELTGRTVSWSVSDANVADISSSGLLTGKRAGTTEIDAVSEGIVGVVSATVVQTNPSIALDPPSLSFVAVGAADPKPQTVVVRNTGVLALNDLTVGPIVYDAGQPGGWLSAALSGSSAPSNLTVTAAIAGLPWGTYHAKVPIVAPSASNSPAMLSVTLAVNVGAHIVYGSSLEKTQLVNAGETTSPGASAIDATGQPIALPPVTFTSRAPSVARVGADGTITAIAEGQGWIVAYAGAVGDSIYVIVPHGTTGPVARTGLTTYEVRANEVTAIDVLLDVRSGTIGAATVAVGVTTVNDVFGTITYDVAAGAPNPVINSPTFGIIKASIVSANGFTGQIPLLRLTVSPIHRGLDGWIDVSIIDITDTDGKSILPASTSTRYPIVVR